MKKLSDCLGKYTEQEKHPVNLQIEVLIRRGKVTYFKTPKNLVEMRCQDCGSINGHTTWEGRKRAWFCGNNECLQRDAEIFRQKKERLRQEEARKQALEIRKQKEALAWDGS